MPQAPNMIHDAFFKQIMSEPQIAERFLREQLPPQLAALLGPQLPNG